MVAFLGWFETERELFLAMEFCRYGNLDECIKSIEDEREVREIMGNVLGGLGILHSKGFIHGDLKPQVRTSSLELVNPIFKLRKI